MGQAIDFPQRNDFIGKPNNMTDNQCYALPVARIATYIPGETDEQKPFQVHAHVSCWELSEEERAEVAKTGKVYVKILGLTLAPMSVHGKLPIYNDSGDISDVLFTTEQVEEMKKAV